MGVHHRVGPRAALSGTEALEVGGRRQEVGGRREEPQGGPEADVEFLRVVPGVKQLFPSEATNSGRAD